MSGSFDRKKQKKVAQRLVAKTHFKEFECECLVKQYRALTKTSLDRAKFRDILHKDFKIHDDVMMDRIFKVFDKDNDSYVSLEEWIMGLSIFLRGTLQEKIKFCFDIYDLNADGWISREEMFQLLKNSMMEMTIDAEELHEGVPDLVDMAMKKMDMDHDNRVTLSDFTEAVKSNSLLLEFFGQCLPDFVTVQAYMTLISPH